MDDYITVCILNVPYNPAYKTHFLHAKLGQSRGVCFIQLSGWLPKFIARLRLRQNSDN